MHRKASKIPSDLLAQTLDAERSDLAERSGSPGGRSGSSGGSPSAAASSGEDGGGFGGASGLARPARVGGRSHRRGSVDAIAGLGIVSTLTPRDEALIEANQAAAAAAAAAPGTAPRNLSTRHLSPPPSPPSSSPRSFASLSRRTPSTAPAGAPGVAEAELRDMAHQVPRALRAHPP